MKIRSTIIVVFVVLFLAFLLVNIPELIKSIKEKKVVVVEDIFKLFRFSSSDALKSWRNKVFKGKTIYWIDEKENDKFLHSESKGTASALYHLVTYNVKEFPYLGWKWRPLKFPDKQGVVDPKLKDDYALRLYVVFCSGFFANFRCLEYVWDETIKEGTIAQSPYSDKIMQLVVRQGFYNGEWIEERRNLLEDYVKLFGKYPSYNVRAIAIMSDSEGTKDSCEAYFKEIKIIKRI